ncbi:MAG: hypothetical protein FWF88_06055 [Peptococcaceae bacterium]|nr:hypothetical protein [Peptococcaceae bacterium]
MQKTRKLWFVIGGIVSILWGALHVMMFLPTAFDPTSVSAVLPDGAVMNDAAMIYAGNLITLLNNALIIYMVGIGLLMIFGARTFAADSLGTGLLVVHIVFWVVRAVVPLFQVWTDNLLLNLMFVLSLAVYVIPLFLKQQREPAATA